MSFKLPSDFTNILKTNEQLNPNEFSLKRKHTCIEDNEEEGEEEEEDENYTYLNSTTNNTNDIILSDCNVNTYNKPHTNPLLVDIYGEFRRIKQQIKLQHSNNYVHFGNYKKLNDNIKYLFRDNSEKFHDLDVKIDLLNTKMNTVTTILDKNNKDNINMTQKLCSKIEKLEKEIKKLKK